MDRKIFYFPGFVRKAISFSIEISDGVALYRHRDLYSPLLAICEQISERRDIFFNISFFEGDKPCQYGLVYSSVMGRGTAQIVEDVEEKKKAMSILMKTQTGKDFSFDEKLVGIVAVIRIDVSEYTAKHRPLPEKMR